MKEFTMSNLARSQPPLTSVPADAQQFDKLHTFIKPKIDELRWTEIPWEIYLGHARQKAALKKTAIVHLGDERQSPSVVPETTALRARRPFFPIHRLFS